MTTEDKESCAVCMNCYNETNHQDMVLHCGHNFCLSCLVSLHSSGSHKCPNCRADWIQFELQALALLKPQASANGSEVQEVLKEDKKKQTLLCKKHQFPFVYWQEGKKVFYCKQCVIEEVSDKLMLIEDAVPLITADIAQKVSVAHKQGREDLQNLEKVIADFNGKLDYMRLFQKQIEEDMRFLAEMIESLKVLFHDRSSVSDKANELENNCRKFKSEADLNIIMNARNVLEELVKPAVLPLIDESKRALYNMVPSLAVLFGVESNARNPPSIAATIIESLLTLNDDVLQFLMKQSRLQRHFKENSSWTIDNKNYLAALLAWFHNKKKPAGLTLISHYDNPNALPKWALSDIAKSTAGIKVKARFLDAFYKPQLASNNNGKLKKILHYDCLTQFVGHLDAVGIASLPASISILGLAIDSAADAEAVGNLQPWEHLTHFCVAVSNRVSVQDLKPLPGEAVKILHFFGLADEEIHRVRPVISALVPSLRLGCLYLPNCQLTAAGLRSLVQLLQGTTIARVGIELPKKWDTDVRLDIEAEILTAFKGSVLWNMNFLYQ